MAADSEAGKTWPVLSVVIACALAFTVSGLLVIADGLAEVMASWDTPSPGIGWIRVAMVGHCLLAAASVVLFGLGMRRSSRHRSEAIAAWLIIPVALGWFFLGGRLAASA
jgi:hypothetical protein